MMSLRIGKIHGFTYPKSFLKAVELNLIDFDLWYLMDEAQVLQRMKGLQKRYLKRQLIPFARRDDNDDLSCFEMGKGERVFIIHDFASEGYEQREEYGDFWRWLEAAVGEMIEYNKVELEGE
jgi:hypothetical protein